MDEQNTQKRLNSLEKEIAELKQNRLLKAEFELTQKSKVFKKRFTVPLCVLSAMIISAIVIGASIPNSFNTGELLSAAKFNENFTYITNRLWELTGSDLFYTAGNVGIGTDSPGEQLEVVGDVSISGKFTNYGDGSEGDYIADDQTLDGDHQFESFTLSSGSTLTIGDLGWLVIRVKGTTTLAGTIDGNGKGAQGGDGGAELPYAVTGDGNPGEDGINGAFFGGSGGSGGSGSCVASVGSGTLGGAGGPLNGIITEIVPNSKTDIECNSDTNGVNGQAGLTVTSAEPVVKAISTLLKTGIMAGLLGSGGGGGGSGPTTYDGSSLREGASGGNGGSGGSGLAIISKNLIIDGLLTINVNGTNGSNGGSSSGKSYGGAGGGGGGGGGVLILYKNLTGNLNDITVNSSGGAGGSPTSLSHTGGSGGSGGSGAYLIEQL